MCTLLACPIASLKKVTDRESWCALALTLRIGLPIQKKYSSQVGANCRLHAIQRGARMIGIARQEAWKCY